MTHAPLPLRAVLRLALVPLALACAGPPDPEALAPCAPPAEASVLATLSGNAGPQGGVATRGAEVFATTCARCHAPRLIERDSRLFHGYPRLDCAITAEAAPAYLELAIAGGGIAIGRNELMKPFADQLSSDQIADLVAYLLAGAK